MTTTDPELLTEREHHEKARSAMEAMRRSTAEVMGSYEADFVEGRRNRFADDAGPDHTMGHAMSRYGDLRLAALEGRDLPLFFGRLWLDTGEHYHLGRRHVRDETDRSVPLVVDWRAPLAARYYRASASERRGVVRRRRFGFDKNRLSGFEDEDLLSGGVASSNLLRSEIERPRTGPMRDIVATIQPDQDELIRRDADTSLCVQGAPGTGKTAVGLHRAAWLHYTYPERLRRGGMLVLGPTSAFLSYISTVLPTLGETSVRQSTLEQLLGADGTRGTDPDEVARVKHDARMAKVCERTVWGRLGTPDHDLEVTHRGLRFTLTSEQLATAMSRARATARGWDTGRKSLERSVVQAVVRQYEERMRRPADSDWTSQLRRSEEITTFLDQLWPRDTAKALLKRLYTDSTFRAEMCEGLLSPQEQELLHRDSPRLRPTVADVVVLDELQAQLKPRPTDDIFEHVVVDEAQDLSPMQCRAVARRCTGALTVLGDLAQGTTPWSATDWADQMRHLARPDAEHTALTVGMRVPGPVLDLANRLLPHLGVDVPPATSLRSDGQVITEPTRDLATGTLTAVQQALTHQGLVGVIGAQDTLSQLPSSLLSHDRVELVPADEAKGLEFDHVVLLEPAEVGRTESSHRLGLRRLYVCLTRTVTRLTVVHTQDLPPELAPQDRR